MHVAGYKYSEIAEKMNLPLGTIKSRIFLHVSACRRCSLTTVSVNDPLISPLPLLKSLLQD